MPVGTDISSVTQPLVYALVVLNHVSENSSAQFCEEMDEMDLNISDYGDEEDFCRGYGAATNEGIDENFGNVDNTEDEYDEDNPDIDKAPEMPQHFYKEVESFLTREPPKVKDFSSKKIKNLGGKPPSASAPMLPDIYARQSYVPAEAPPKPPQAQSKVREKLLSSTSKPKSSKQSAGLDHNLLREAFAYTDRLLKEAIIEEASSQGAGTDHNEDYPHRQPPIGKSNGKKSNNSSQLRGQPSRTAPIESIYMAPHNDVYQATRKKADSAGSSRTGGPKGGAVKKLRAKIPSESALGYGNDGSSEGAGFNITSEAELDSGKRNPINFDELISNFQGGITLQKLRKELEQSKQSMKNSENFMKQLSKEYLSGGRL